MTGARERRCDPRGTPAWKFDRRLHVPLKRTLEKLGFDVRTKVA